MEVLKVNKEKKTLKETIKYCKFNKEQLEAKEKVLKLFKEFNNEAHNILEDVNMEMGVKWEFRFREA